MTIALEPRTRQIETPMLRPGLGQRLLAMSIPFVLAVGLPIEWFTPAGDERNTGGLTFATIAALVGLGWAVLLPRLDVAFRAVRLEPLAPAFVALAVMSVFWSAWPSATVQSSAGLIVVMLAGWWAVALFDLDELLAYTALALGVACLLSLAFVFGLPQFGDSATGWTGLTNNRNGLGRLATLSLLHSLLAIQVFPRFRLFWLSMSVLACTAVIGSTSRTSLLGLIGVCFCVLVARAFRARRTLFGAVALALATTVTSIVVIATTNLPFVADLLGRDVTLTGRTLLWRSTFEVYLERPLLGWGWDGVWHGYFSPSRSVLLTNTWDPPHAHNAVLEYALTLGIPGFLIGTTILVKVVLRSTRVIERDHSAAALYPLTVGVFSFVFSMTEFGVISRSVFFYCLIIAMLSGARILSRPALDSPAT